MGDRREFLDEGEDGYFQLLETFMGTISEGVTKRGLPAPVFHIFSETLKPCPSETTGVFDEFPTWPVELNQVSPSTSSTEPAVVRFVRFEKRHHPTIRKSRFQSFCRILLSLESHVVMSHHTILNVLGIAFLRT